MTQQTLQTVIVLSGKVDNTFGIIGQTLTTLGNEIDTISQKIIGFGKESVKEHIEYDDIMREVQALGEYDTKAMRALDEYNKSIAQTSKYTMDQAAQAEVLMAQLGLNMDDTRTLMPTVMDLATAANIELADSLDYLYYTLNALDLPMEQVNILADQMSKASAISAADIDTLGQSLQRLGSGAQFFAGGSDEVLAILAGIAKFGNDMQGSDAGTQLRNFMLTLMAPTKAKGEILDSLAISEAEWADFESYMEEAGIELTETAATMEKLGFSIYDASGQMKPAIQIVAELKSALAGMGEEEKNATLGNLFGKRTTITASNLLKALDDIIRYQEQIENGSFGYTEFMAELQEGGLGGALRELTAAWDALETTAGTVIAPTVERVADGLTGIVNSIANMDEGEMTVIADAMGAMAIAGPGLLLAGGAFRIIGHLFTPGGLIAAAIPTIGAAAIAMERWNEIQYESKFGDLTLDNEQISILEGHINTIGSAFETNHTHIDSYNNALETAISDYTTASETFKSNLLTNMLTGAAITPEDQDALKELGNQMYGYVLEGIDQNYAAIMETTADAFDWEETGENSSTWAHIQLALQYGYEESIRRAGELSQQLRDSMTSAFADGSLTAEEVANIQSIMDDMNELVAMQTSIDSYVEQQALLRKAQTLGLDGMEEIAAIAIEQRDSQLERNYTEQDRAYKNAEYWLNYLYEHGQTLEDGTELTPEIINSMLGEMQAGFASDNSKIRLGYLSYLSNLFESTMDSSELDASWELLRSLAGDYLESGTMSQDEYAAFINEVGENLSFIEKFAEQYIESLGGEKSITADIAELLKTEGKTAEQVEADKKTAQNLMELLQMHRISQLDSYGTTSSDELVSAYTEAAGYGIEQAREQFQNLSGQGIRLLAGAMQDGDISQFKEFADNMDNYSFVEGLNSIVARLKEIYDFSKIDMPDSFGSYSDFGAAYALLSGSIDLNDYLIQAEEAHAGMQGIMDDPLEQSVEVDDNGSAASTRSAIESQFSSTIYQRVVTMYGKGVGYGTGGNIMGFAEGGRATVASIFGEAGPEWAIPEEHTDRTAQLLNAAREGAGFTWRELIDRNGGLNAGGGGSRTLIYQPTIIAQDANGVEDKLIEDKNRLDKWYAEKELRDDVEVYS